ncbi:syntaxin-5-like [Lytechinus variegatus]|uniref:syntaxin-5-like n=1 Tax=Lytechinus variegatus TaxID=7654 RepID=UPI001BB20AFD|nr:syntaxin-5-like [Lytechinus variegatus]XP_041467935.1 syntaxin-5-like [Lytechinus variegatus]
MYNRRRHPSTEENIGESSRFSGSSGYHQRSGWTVTTHIPPETLSTAGGVDTGDMTCRDRTQEFLSTIKSMQSRQGNGVTANKLNGKPQQYTDFMRIAKKIGKDLSNTFSKLEKLTLLAKRKSLFDDKSVEIQELTYIIKQDINSLNKQISKLQQHVKGSSQNGRHMQSHSNTVVLSLQSRLANMSNSFKNVLEVRTQNLKEQKSRREQFSSSNTPSSARSSSVLDEQQSNGHMTIDMGGLDGPRHRGQQQSMQMVEQQDNYIKNREETMHNIESTIVELSGIFQQLAHMVKEQEEQVQRIDGNVDDTVANVEAAHSELLKYFQSVTSNRWLMIKVFLVLIVFFIVFVVFVA